MLGRLNPFVHRSSSERQSSPLSSPAKHRTPSILRTLTHHPSLSALKARSRKKRRPLNPTTSAPPSVPDVHQHLPISSPTTPDNRVQQDEWAAPDSVRVTTMRFEIEIDSPRGRASSDSVRLASPSTSRFRGNTSPRPLSFSARPINFAETPSPSPHFYPKTTQHPHPVPLPDSAVIDSYEATSYYTPGDFIPLTESGRTVDLDDGLDLLASQEDFLTETPGGTKGDFKRVALVDGAKLEKNGDCRSFSPASNRSDNFEAVRYFSRDTYDQPLFSTPNPSSNGLCPSAPLNSFDRPVQEAEDLTNEAELEGVPSESLANFRGTSLSTIKESPSFCRHHSSTASSTSPIPGMTSLPLPIWTAAKNAGADRQSYTSHATGPRNQTQYFTPTSSPSGRVNGLPILTLSPFLPPRHLSAPPIYDFAHALIDTRSECAKRLKEEVNQSRWVINELEVDVRRMRDSLDEERKERSKLSDTFGELELSHKSLVARYVDLVQERDTLTSARHRDAATLEAAQKAQGSLQQEMRVLHNAHQKAAAQRAESELCIVDLQRARAEVEAQLEATADDYTALLASHQDQLGSARRQTIDRDNMVAELQSRICDIERTHQKLHSAVEADLAIAQQTLVKKDSVIALLRDKLQTVIFENDEGRVRITGLEKEIAGTMLVVEERHNAVAATEVRLEEGRNVWTNERTQLFDILNQSQQSASTLQLDLAILTDELVSSRQALGDLKAAFHSKSQRLDYSELEIKHLRIAVADAEEALVRSIEDAERGAREAERDIRQFEEQLHDIHFQHSAQESALRAAVTEAASERAKSDDARSRLETYLTEVDRLKLAEATLLKEMDDLRRTSALDEIRSLELSKRINDLERDRDLLNVALDSKQTELILVQRSTRPTNNTPRRNQRTHTQAQSPEQSTPKRSRGLSTSISSTSLRHTHKKRDSIEISPATPRVITRPALAASTRHNAPDQHSPTRPQTWTRPVPPGSTGQKTPELTRRSSLPLLVGRSRPASVSAKVASLVEETAEELA